MVALPKHDGHILPYSERYTKNLNGTKEIINTIFKPLIFCRFDPK